jgi:hypothetical protein
MTLKQRGELGGTDLARQAAGVPLRSRVGKILRRLALQAPGLQNTPEGAYLFSATGHRRRLRIPKGFCGPSMPADRLAFAILVAEAKCAVSLRPNI